MSNGIDRLRSLRISLWFAIFAVAVAVALKLLERLPYVGLPLDSAPAERMLDLLLDMTNIVTSFSTGLLGALGLILVSGPEASRGQKVRPAAFLCGVFAVISTTFGFLVYEQVFDIVKLGFFSIDIVGISLARYGQLITFVAALGTFGYFAVRTFEADPNVDKDKSVVSPIPVGAEPDSL
jgi:hypothetical protein